MFDNTVSGASQNYGPRTSHRSKSDSTLPDLIQSSTSHEDGNEKDGSILNGGDKSPDIVGIPVDMPRRKSILKNDGNNGDQVQMRNPKKLDRSVSFQGTSPAQEKRVMYRHSSGYFTGSEKTNSLQSQNSQTSNISSDNSVWQSEEDENPGKVNFYLDEMDDNLPNLSELSLHSYIDQVHTCEPSLIERGLKGISAVSDSNNGIPTLVEDFESLVSNTSTLENTKNTIRLESTASHTKDSALHVIAQQKESNVIQNFVDSAPEVSFSYSGESKNVQLEYRFMPNVHQTDMGNEDGGTVSQFMSEGFSHGDGVGIPFLSLLHTVSEDGDRAQDGEDGSDTKFYKEKKDDSTIKSKTDKIPSPASVSNDPQAAFDHSRGGDSSSAINNHGPLIPDFGELLPDDASHNLPLLPGIGDSVQSEDDSSVQLPSDICGQPLSSTSDSPSFIFVRDRYCNGEDREPLQSHPAPITPSQYVTAGQSIPTPSWQRARASLQTLQPRELYEMFLENPELFEFQFPFTFYRRILNMPSDGSVSQSPSPLATNIGMEGMGEYCNANIGIV